MYNIQNYNFGIYNNEIFQVSESSDAEIAYNGYNLQSDTIKISRWDFDNSHRIQSDTFDRPIQDGGGELNYFFREKIVTFEGTMTASDAESLNNEIDRLKRILLQNNKDLDIKINGTTRRAKASLINGDSLFTREHYNITFIPFVLTFRVLEKFKETTRQIESLTGQTAGFSEAIYNFGTAKAEPTVIFTINTASSVDETSFSVGDDTLTINEALSASDILTIDCENLQVFKNDAEIDYTGTFPKLDIGENTYTIGINGTVDYNFTIYYYNTYL